MQKQISNYYDGFDKNNIVFIDSASLLNLVFNCKSIHNKDKAMENLGFVALVKFKRKVDALEIYVGEKTLSLPLNDGTLGHPKIMLCSRLEKEFEGDE